MRKVLVFQHVAHRILGTLNPTLKESGLNVRYVNFQRTPQEHPKMERYNGLVVMGGNMGVYESDSYPHIKTELKIIEEALRKGVPVLGVCLGSQLIAQVLGSSVRKHSVPEIGWHDVHFKSESTEDHLFDHFGPQEKLFQFHGDTFDIPRSAVQLASSESCDSQAFRYQEKVYGLQFHLEVDEAMIRRWMSTEANLKMMSETTDSLSTERILHETVRHIQRSMDLSTQTFKKFVELFDLPERSLVLGTDHAKDLNKIKGHK